MYESHLTDGTAQPENAATRARFSKMHDFYAKKQRLIGELGALEIRSFGDDSVTVALTALPGDSVIAEALAVKLSFESDSTTLVNASVCCLPREFCCRARAN